MAIRSLPPPLPSRAPGCCSGPSWHARALLVYAIACCSYVAPAHTGDSRGQAITVEDGIVLVDAMVNGRGPFRMVVDTGGAACILSPAAARKAGVVYDHRTILATLGGERPVPATSNSVIQVDGQREPGVELAVAEIPQFRALRSRSDGVLGQSFLSRTPYLIDYRKRRIWFGDAATQESNRLPLAMATGGMGGRIVVPVVLEPGGRTWRLTLDSGARHMVVECRAGCPDGRRTSERLITYAGEHPISRSTFTRVRVGGIAMPTMDALIVNAAPPDNQDEGVLPTRWFSAVYVDSLTLKLAAP